MKHLIYGVFIFFLTAGSITAQTLLSVYTSLDETLSKELFEQYERETGVRINFIYLSGGEAVERMEAEIENPRASIWVGGANTDHFTAMRKNLTMPYISREADNTPSRYRDSDNYWIGLYIDPLVISTNNNRAKFLGLTPPESWNDLLKPEYRGQIRVEDQYVYSVITAVRYVFYGNENHAFDFLRRLDVNIDHNAFSLSALDQSLAAGEVFAAVCYASGHARLRSAGANIEINVPAEGTVFELASMSIIRGGRQPLQARQLYDWILSSHSAQRIFARWCFIPVRNGAVISPFAPALDQLRTVNQNIQWEGDPANRTRLLDRWNSEIGSIR